MIPNAITTRISFGQHKLNLQILSCKQQWLQLLLQRHIFIHVPLIVPTLSRHAPCGGGGCKFRAISKARLWRYRLYTCLLSTSSSLTALMRKSNLVAGFALRCFQRLSDPDMDTRRCAWRHNRQTRGQSDTVLSY